MRMKYECLSEGKEKRNENKEKKYIYIFRYPTRSQGIQYRLV